MSVRYSHDCCLQPGGHAEPRCRSHFVEAPVQAETTHWVQWDRDYFGGWPVKASVLGWAGLQGTLGQDEYASKETETVKNGLCQLLENSVENIFFFGMAKLIQYCKVISL